MTAIHLPAAVRILLVLGATFLAGCASTPPSWDSDLPAAKISRWDAKGKLGLVHQGQAKSVSFHWQNRKQKYDIRLFGMLGIGGAHFKGGTRGVSLTTKNGTYYAADADTLVEESLNLSIPVVNLVYWIKGVPSPATPVTDKTFHPNGTLASLKQQGWTLRYPSHYLEQNPVLPKKIIAEREGLKLTIAIKSWQL